MDELPIRMHANRTMDCVQRHIRTVHEDDTDGHQCLGTRAKMPIPIIESMIVTCARCHTGLVFVYNHSSVFYEFNTFQFQTLFHHW